MSGCRGGGVPVAIANATRKERILRRASTVVRWLLWLVLLVNAIGFLLLPISDPDMFWHLRTGEWIHEHRSLPAEYLFALPPLQTAPAIQRFTMTSYWLAQVLLAALYGTGGFVAIIALRWVLFFLLLLLVARRSSGDAHVRAGLLSLAVILLGQYPVERPQFYSFVFAALLLSLLSGLREPGSPAAARWRTVAVPSLMALWANCHGGFVVGLGLLGVFALAESLKVLHHRFEPLPPQRLRLLLAATAGGFLASLLNPNGWQAVRLALHPAAGFVSELRSTVEVFRFYAEPWVIVYWTLLALVGIGLALRWRTPDPTTLALVALTGFFSFTTVRHVPFFVVVALPPAVAALSDPRFVRWTRPVVAAVGLGAGVLLLPGATQSTRNPQNCVRVNSTRFPTEAATFIQNEGLQGTMFNNYDWGGYLLWRLAPRKVFIDGRGGDPALVEAYGRVLDGDRRRVGGQELWKYYLDRYDVQFTVTPFFYAFSGRLFGLVDTLLADPGWVPVFASPTTIIFARDVAGNRGVIERNALPKETFYLTLLDFTDRLIAGTPNFTPPFVAQGDLFLRLGDRAAALRSYQEALRIAPAHPVALERVAKVSGGGALRMGPSR